MPSTMRPYSVLAGITLALLAVLPASAIAAPGDLEAQWNFDGGTNPWSDGAQSGLESDAGGQSLELSAGEVAASPSVDLSGEPAAELSLWWSRGSDQDGFNFFGYFFDYDPESDEDLVIEYSSDGGANWQTATTVSANGPSDAKGTETFQIPQADLTAQFQVRARNTGTADGFGGGDLDDRWFIDTVTITETAPPLGATLLTEYRMENGPWEGAAGEVVDASGNGHDATSEGDAGTAIADPAIGGDPGTCEYAELDGSGDYVVDNDADEYLNGLSRVTVMAWVRNTASTPVDAGIFNTGTTSGQDNNFGLRYDAAGASSGSTSGLKASLNTDQCASGQDCIQVETESGLQIQDQWQHVAMTWTSGERIRVFIEGQEVQATLVAGSGNLGGVIDDVDFLRVGQSPKGGEDWQGAIDEFRVYNNALSQSEIADMRDATHPCTTGGAGLVAEYRMDESGWNGTNGEILDTSGNGLDGTARTSGSDNSLPDTVPAKVCNGGRFRGQGFNDSDGTSVDAQHYAEVPDADALSPLASTRATTISGWFRLNSGNAGTLLYKGLDYSSREYRIFLDGGQFRATVWGQNREETANLSASVSAGNWYFFAMTASNPNGNRLELELRMYDENGLIDSVARTNNSFFRQFGNKPLTASLLFGATNYGSGPTNFIDGTLDEVRIHDRVLSNADLIDIRDRTRPCPPTVDHYAILDPGQGLTCEALPVTIEARDDSGNPVDPSAGTTIDIAAVIPGGTTPAPDTSWASSGSEQTSYTFGGSVSSVTLQLRRTSPGGVNVDVDDGSATEIASADPDIPFAETGFLFYADGAPNAIGNQIAAKSSGVAPNSQSIAVRAVEDPNGPTPGAACEARFSDNQTIEMGFECTDPDTCSGSRQVGVNGADIPGNDAGSVSSYGNVTLDFGANGSAPLELVYPDAGEIRLHAREELAASGDDPAVTLTGTSNRFIVRPFGLRITAAGNPGATTATANVYQAAGTDFTATVTAVGWSSGDDSDDSNGMPDGYDNNDPIDNADLSDNMVLPNFGPESSDESVTINSVLYRPTGGNDPALGGTPSVAESAFEDGSDAGLGQGETSLRYAEVGIIELRAALADGDYLGTGVDVPGRSGPVGRFIPADFDQTATDGMFRNVCAAVHTYIGQEFSYQSGGVPTLTITARNGATPPATTQNYTGAFAKLVPGDIDRTGPTTDGSQNGADGTPLEVVPSLSMGTLTDNGDGTLTYTFASDDTYRYERNLDRDGNNVNDARVAPFDSDLTVTIDAIVDSDNVSAPAANREDVEPAATELRFGRLVIDNAAGAEVAPIEQVLRAEYFESDASGDRWPVNTDDGCSSFALDTEVRLANNDDADSPVPGDNEIDVAGGTTSIQETGPIALTSGTALLTFSAPGAGNTGWVDTTPLLTGVEHPYLAIDPEGDGSWTTNPTGRVTFGIYTGPDARILLREIPAN